MTENSAHIARPKKSGTLYISQRAIKKSFGQAFSKSAEPTGNQRTHITHPKPSGTMYISQRAIKKSFGQAFSKACGVKRGRAPEKRRFSFCEAFSFAPLVSKEKAKE